MGVWEGMGREGVRFGGVVFYLEVKMLLGVCGMQAVSERCM